MSETTLNRAEAIRDFEEGRLSRAEVAQAIGVTERTVSRLARSWKRNGVLGLEHHLLGKTPNHRTDPDLRFAVLSLLRNKYFGFNLKHFHERLTEVEKIEVGYPSLKRWAKSEGLTKVKKRRGKIRKRRKRFSSSGYLLQMDGSDHRWFNGKETCLIAAIDDATNDIAYGEFFETECLEGYMRVLRRIIELKGIPRVLYVDRASFLSGISKDEERGQFARMCDELGIRIVRAYSPEGKGRIERAWGTLQDRLVSELRLQTVTTKEEATRVFNETFLPDYRKRFLVTPENERSLFRPIPRSLELDQIFCLKFTRKIRKDHTMLWDNELYEIKATLTASLVRYEVEIRIYPDQSIRAYFGGRDLEVQKSRSEAWPRRESRPRPQDWLRLGKQKPLSVPVVE